MYEIYSKQFGKSLSTLHDNLPLILVDLVIKRHDGVQTRPELEQISAMLKHNVKTFVDRPKRFSGYAAFMCWVENSLSDVNRCVFGCKGMKHKCETVWAVVWWQIWRWKEIQKNTKRT